MITKDEAAGEVIRKDRSCKRWDKYVPGQGPIQQLAELKAEPLEQDR